MPRIYVEWFPGRTKETRDTLAEKMTELVVDVVKVKPDDVAIVFRENPREMVYEAGKPSA